MRRRGLRLTLVVGFIAVTAGAGYAVWTLESREAATRAALASADAQAERARRALADFGAALEACVAVGQRTTFWAPRVAAAIDAYADAAAEMALTAPAGTANLVGQDDLAQLDLRVRQLVDGEQPLVASDLLFTDGLEMIRGAVARVDEVSRARRALGAAALADVVLKERLAAATVIAAALLVIGLLAPGGGPGAPASAQPGDSRFNVATPVPASDSDASPGAALDARTDDRQRPATTRSPAPAVDLLAAADLCSDLGRLADASTLPSLLARTAGLLSARGLTIWVADPSGRLYPTAAHGYSAQALSRLGTLDPNDDNATSAAYRTSSAQTVEGDTSRAGALVVPLMGGGGCVGVLAAEMEGGRERDASARALARIVAAQLATLIPAGVESAASEARVARAESG